MTRPRIAIAPRLPLLAAGGLALAAGLYGGLLRLGFALPGGGGRAGVLGAALADVHGPVMVLGFVGTLVALERAIALGRRWALAAPACSGAGALVLLAAGPGWPGKLLLATAGVLLLGVYVALWRRQPSPERAGALSGHAPALLAQMAGAFAWYAAALLWLAGLPLPDLVPWLATFVVATIAGERLDLARIASPAAPVSPPADTGDGRGPRPAAQPHGWFLAALAALLAGATAATLWPSIGAHLFGAGLLAVIGWLTTFDVARRTVRARGLPRYVAVGLLTGYAWLAVAGVLATGAGRTVAGAGYDAMLHAIFLGFAMSMIFVHAPVILPAVLRRPLPYRPVLYAPLILLHGSLLLRMAVGDGLGVETVWRWTGAANVVAVLAFASCAVALAVRARPRRPAAVSAGTPTPAVVAGAPR